MPVIAEWAATGLIAASFILFAKWLVLTTPLAKIPGLPQVWATI